MESFSARSTGDVLIGRLGSWTRREESPTLCLLGAMVVAAGFSLWVTRDQTFFSDEWHRVVLYPGLSFEATLHGLSGHLILGHVYLYRALLDLFGADSYLPFRVTEAALNLTCGWLFYVYVREGSDRWLAAAAATLLLFLGAAWEVIATPYGIVILLPIAFGLAALNCLKRSVAGWDVAACALLVVGVISQDFILPFFAGALVMLAVRSGWNVYRSAWVVAIPLLIYAAWFLWSRIETTYSFLGADPVRIGNVAKVPSTLVALCAIGASTAAGTFRGASGFDISAGYLLLALLAIVVMRQSVALWRPSPDLWVPVGMMLAFGFLVGMAMSGDRAPTATRYTYLATLLILMFSLKLLVGRRLSVWARAGAGAILFAGLVANVVSYHEVGKQIGQIGIQNRASLSALDIAGTAVDPAFSLESVPTSYGITNNRKFTDAQYRAAVNRFGSPALAPTSLASQGELAARTADQALIAAERISLTDATGRLSKPTGSCTKLAGRPAAPTFAPRTVAPGGAVEARAVGSGAGVTVSARRFGTGYESLGTVNGGSVARIAFPSDNSITPWRLLFATAQPGFVCPIASQR